MVLFHLNLTQGKWKFEYDKNNAQKGRFLLEFTREIDELAELICTGDTAAKRYFAKPDDLRVECALDDATKEINAKTRKIEILRSLKDNDHSKYFKTSAYSRLAIILQNTTLVPYKAGGNCKIAMARKTRSSNSKI